MTPILDPYFLALAIPAAMLIGFSKSGFSGVGGMAVPLMSLAITVPQAAAVTLPILLMGDVLALHGYRGKVDKALFKAMVPGGIAGILLGWALFNWVDPRWIKAIIGVEAVLFGLQKLLEGKSAWEGPGLALNKVKAFVCTGASGFASFISHSGGPPIMQLLLPMKLEKVVMTATLTWFFSMINFAKIGPYLQLGVWKASELATSLMLLPLVPVGFYIGRKLLTRISVAGFIRFSSFLLVVTGLKLLWDAFFA